MEWHNFTNDERQQIGRPNHWSSFDLFGLIPVYSRAATVVRTYTLFYGFAWTTETIAGTFLGAAEPRGGLWRVLSLLQISQIANGFVWFPHTKTVERTPTKPVEEFVGSSVIQWKNTCSRNEKIDKSVESKYLGRNGEEGGFTKCHPGLTMNMQVGTWLDWMHRHLCWCKLDLKS